MAEAKKNRRPKRQKAPPADKLGLRLVKLLEWYKERRNPKELSDLHQHIGLRTQQQTKLACGS